ncbi:hypothetical protein [Streptomyces griseofuscus]|uniref:Uncharacterized protein n=1 Tax=Streptomyces griseofuscus TaxID=146922 RepID=A0A7H1Q9U2_9ACTN|nr:hypothetical protein [Streptomyces griseofuscus]QNT97072.1 hypothetical protein HEP81_06838 [Streptomyces griseofuscus]BBC97670.1 hypothetical protein SRO_6494 [Streptomyces rochei]
MDTSPETSSAAAPATYKVAITEQHTGRILLFDRNAQWTDANVRWSFSTGNATGWDHPFEIRFRDTQRYGMIALMTFGKPGEGRAAIVNVSSKAHLTRADVLWSARITTYPHCIERVPGTGTVVVAGSRDRLHVFGPSSSDPATLKEVQTLAFTKAHAVLWDDQNGLLWVTGGTVIRSYHVTGTMRDARLVKQGADIAIAGNGHDIQPDYSRPGTLLVSDSHHVYSLDKKTRKVTTLVKMAYPKSYVRHANGQSMWTTDTNEDDSAWGGPTVHFSAGGDRTRAGAQIYKARLYTTQFH